MKTEDRLRRVFALLVEAVKRDPELAHEIERELGQTVAHAPSPSPHRNRRKPAAFDPFVVLAEGEAALRARLQGLDTDGLLDIVAEHGMDPGKLVRKWKSQDRLIDHIVATVQARSRKGDAFRT
jgi:CheY-like chemotaxis protein